MPWIQSFINFPFTIICSHLLKNETWNLLIHYCNKTNKPNLTIKHFKTFWIYKFILKGPTYITLLGLWLSQLLDQKFTYSNIVQETLHSFQETLNASFTCVFEISTSIHSLLHWSAFWKKMLTLLLKTYIKIQQITVDVHVCIPKSCSNTKTS